MFGGTLGDIVALVFTRAVCESTDLLIELFENSMFSDLTNDTATSRSYLL